MKENYHSTGSQEGSVFRNVLLCAAGLLINLIFSKTVIFFNLPLYVDNVGSIFVAVLGGPILGMAVGFLSNVLGSLSTPISMYYSIFTILIAWLASVYARKGLLKKWWGWLLAAGSFVLLGGGAGSVVTWLLYGQTISGIAEPYALALTEQGITPFFAQLLVDIVIDIPDKLITVFLSWGLLTIFPKNLRTGFPYSYWYYKKGSSETEEANRIERQYKHPLKNRLVGIVTITIVLIGFFSLASGTYYYQKQLSQNSENIAQMVASKAALCVNGDKVDKQLAGGIRADGYLDTKEKINDVYVKAPSAIRYVYVYQIREDGIYVVYDADVPGEKGQEIGKRVEKDPDIENRMEEFLTGKEVKSGESNNNDGTFLSAYVPVKNSEGKTVAYACADIDMISYRNEMLVYIIQNAALLFAVILLATYITTWFVNRHVTEPIQRIVSHTKALGRINPELWLESNEWKNKNPIDSGDELEELYTAVTATEENTSINVKKRMDAEQELVQTRALEDANRKLEAMVKRADEAVRVKNDFYARMSHDMRTPMNGILGITELAKDETDPVVLQEELAKINQSGIYMLSLINDTLDLQRMESNKMTLNPEICNSNDIVGSALAMVQNSANEKGVHLQINNVNDDFDNYIRIDPVRVRQVVINLLSNAIKFTPKGGTVSFELEVLSREENCVHDKITIADTGIGMSEDFIQNHLFVPFMQENNDMTMQYAGSGLGLSIVKRLVDLMGATIEVDSELGSGTTFTIWIDFELVPEEESKQYFAKKNSQVATNESLLKGKRILLCEDHPLNAEITKRLIKRADGTCEWAQNGREGVEMIENHAPGFYDAILMDIRMPVMDGLQTAEAIRRLDREDTKTIPIIAMSANAYEEDIQKSLKSGMNAHLAKPVDPQKLYQILSEYLGC